MFGPSAKAGRVHCTPCSAALFPGDALGQGWSCWYQEFQHCQHCPASSSALHCWTMLNRLRRKATILQHTSYRSGVVCCTVAGNR